MNNIKQPLSSTITRFVSIRLAGNILLAVLMLLTVFHVFVVLGIVPLENIWGGQIESRSTLIIAEIVAISMTALFMMIVAVRTGYVQIENYAKLFRFGAWFMFAFFALNTLGNLAAATIIEKLIFTPMTLLLMLCAWRLALGEQA